MFLSSFMISGQDGLRKDERGCFMMISMQYARMLGVILRIGGKPISEQAPDVCCNIKYPFNDPIQRVVWREDEVALVKKYDSATQQFGEQGNW